MKTIFSRITLATLLLSAAAVSGTALAQGPDHPARAVHHHHVHHHKAAHHKGAHHKAHHKHHVQHQK